MALFYTDFLSLVCANIEIERQWWIAVFDCKQAKVPKDWDCQLPSDVALTLPGADTPAILLSDQAEVQQAGYERLNNRPILFCTSLKRAHEHLRLRQITPSPIQDAGGTQFFEIHDPEGNVIEICREP